MEHGEIKSYAMVEKTDRVRRVNAQSHHYLSTNTENYKNLVQKVLKRCNLYHVFTMTRAYVINPKLMKHRELCTGTFDLHVLPLDRPLVTLKWIVK